MVSLLAPVVQRLDNTIQRISVDKTNHAIHWIAIYPVDSVIHPLNNWGQMFKILALKRQESYELYESCALFIFALT